LNGTTTTKPAFIISPDTGGTADLPANVRGGSVLRGLVYYEIENQYSFDPLRINSDLTAPQGWMVIVVRSGSLVLGRDSVNGATTAMPPNTTYRDSIPMSTGNINSSITIDLTVNSPQGPASEPQFIDATKLLLARAEVVGFEVASASIDVVGAALDSGDPVELPKDVVPEGMIDRVVSGRFEMTMLNPFAVVGNMDVAFTYQPGQQPYIRSLAIPSGATPQTLPAQFDSTEMRNILRGQSASGLGPPFSSGETQPSTLTIGGVVNSGATPITVTPRQAIQITNRLVLQVRAFGAKEN
jgi:hypothetical protein